MGSSFQRKSVEYSQYVDRVVGVAKVGGAEEFGGGLMAIGTYHNFIKGMLINYPQYSPRETAEKLARDLIAAGGKSVCVLTALTRALAGPTPNGYVYQKSSLQVEKELREFGSVDAFLKALAGFQEPGKFDSPNECTDRSQPPAEIARLKAQQDSQGQVWIPHKRHYDWDVAVCWRCRCLRITMPDGRIRFKKTGFLSALKTKPPSPCRKHRKSECPI